MLGRRFPQSDTEPEFARGTERRRAGRFQRHSVQNVAPRGRHPASGVARGPVITHIRNKCYIRSIHYSNYPYHIRTIPLARFGNTINSPLRTECLQVQEVTISISAVRDMLLRAATCPRLEGIVEIRSAVVYPLSIRYFTSSKSPDSICAIS